MGLQLAPLNVEEQWFYSELLQGDRAPYPMTISRILLSSNPGRLRSVIPQNLQHTLQSLFLNRWTIIPVYRSIFITNVLNHEVRFLFMVALVNMLVNLSIITSNLLFEHFLCAWMMPSKGVHTHSTGFCGWRICATRST